MTHGDGDTRNIQHHMGGGRVACDRTRKHMQTHAEGLQESKILIDQCRILSRGIECKARVIYAQKLHPSLQRETEQVRI
jgi:hypothetical protein